MNKIEITEEEFWKSLKSLPAWAIVALIEEKREAICRIRKGGK